MSICVGCGICCDGSLFANADLEPLESSAPLTQRGVNVYLTEKGVQQFSLPCSAFTGESCGMYDERPTICRTFSCRLLDSHEAGQVDEPTARSLIAQVHALRNEVRPQLEPLLPNGAREPLSALYRRLIQSIDESTDRKAAQRANANLLFSIVALRRILASHFEHPPDKQVRESADWDGDSPDSTGEDSASRS